MMRIENVDIASPAFKANPYPFYARLRAEAPVFRVTLPDQRAAWLVTRYDDVVSVLKDNRFIKEKRKVMSPEQAAREPWIPGMFRPTRAAHARSRPARSYAVAGPGAQGVHAAT